MPSLTGFRFKDIFFFTQKGVYYIWYIFLIRLHEGLDLIDKRILWRKGILNKVQRRSDSGDVAMRALRNMKAV